MSNLLLKATSKGKLSGGGHTCRCAIGKGGLIAAAQKREGDGASPIGTWPMRRVFYRADRLDRPETALPCTALRQYDGWCDAPDHPLYNRPVSLPFAASHETLWREDQVYDVIVELGHNDSTPEPNMGSAIFMHIAKPTYAPTEGCIAIAKSDMLKVLAKASPGAALQITY